MCISAVICAFPHIQLEAAQQAIAKERQRMAIVVLIGRFFLIASMGVNWHLETVEGP